MAAVCGLPRQPNSLYMNDNFPLRLITCIQAAARAEKEDMKEPSIRSHLDRDRRSTKAWRACFAHGLSQHLNSSAGQQASSMASNRTKTGAVPLEDWQLTCLRRLPDSNSYMLSVRFNGIRMYTPSGLGLQRLRFLWHMSRFP